MGSVEGREVSQAAECVFMTHTISGNDVRHITPGCEGVCEGQSPCLPAGHCAQPCSEICLPGYIRHCTSAFLRRLAEGMGSESPPHL